MSETKNGFSVILNKLKGGGVDKFTNSAALYLESSAESLSSAQTNILVQVKLKECFRKTIYPV